MIEAQRTMESKRRASALTRHQNLSAEMTRRKLVDEQTPVQRRGEQDTSRGNATTLRAFDLDRLTGSGIHDVLKRSLPKNPKLGLLRAPPVQTTSMQSHHTRLLPFKSLSATTRVFIESGTTFTIRRTKTTLVTPTAQLSPPIFVKSGTTYTDRRTKLLPASSKTHSVTRTGTSSSADRRTKTLIHSSPPPSTTSTRSTASDNRKTKTASGTGTSQVPKPTPSAQCASGTESVH